ncbi:MAG: HAD family hydrolase [Planctomycetes bacterium]|nr:HAD family hydrolase [Planctomycetota bacterium]
MDGEGTHHENLSPCRRKAVFLDRDGVINRNIVRGNVTHPPDRVEDFELLPGVLETAQRLVRAGFVLVVITNQPDVARGKQKREVVERMNDIVRSALPVLDVLACYHDGSDHCPCRKPKPGMLLEAARRWDLDLERSFMVGDRWSDVLAGQAAGCRTVLIADPYSGAERCRPDHTAAALPAAADWILTFPIEDDQ